jgi:hypothetical protein
MPGHALTSLMFVCFPAKKKNAMDLFMSCYCTYYVTYIDTSMTNDYDLIILLA